MKKPFQKKRILGLILIVAVLTGLLFVNYFLLSEKVFVIGVLNYTEAAEPTLAGFKAGLDDLGFEEGRQVRYIYNGVFHDRKSLAEQATYLVKKKVDLIFSMSTPATLAVKRLPAKPPYPLSSGRSTTRSKLE